MTGKGTGAISTIELFGDSAQSVLGEIFNSGGGETPRFETGRILLGTITDKEKEIDQVTLGCEGPESFAIHCHGNPLIVEMIMELLCKHGVQPATPQQLLADTLAAQGCLNTIAIEARLAQPEAKTIEGTKIIANQIDDGLVETAQRWLESLDEVPLNEIKSEAATILQSSRAAGLIIYGCKAVLTGPPNSGKSTLLNCLAGRRKAIVTDIKGTTRDWIEAECRIGPLSVTLIDTAGVDEQPCEPQQTDFRASSGPAINDGGASPTLRAFVDTAGVDQRQAEAQRTIEQAAREMTAEVLTRADLVLLVLDGSRPGGQLAGDLLAGIRDKPVITILNKSDLPARLDTAQLPKFLPEPVRISAREGTGIQLLTQTVCRTLRTADPFDKLRAGFDVHQPICFTNRQEDLLKQLTNAQSKQRATSIIADLLDGGLQA